MVYLLLLLVAAGLILSVSIGALIAAACAVFVWLVFQRPSIHSVLALATLTACVVALLTLQSIRGAPDPLERFETATSTSSQAGVVQVGSVRQRIGTYRVAMERIEENPFVGVGLDLFSITRPFGIEAYEYDVHNLVIGLWYKTGLFGLVGMLLALFAILRSGWTAIVGVDLGERADTRRRSRQLGRCLRRLCDDRADPLHAAWVDLSSTRPRLSRRTAREVGIRAGRAPEVARRPVAALSGRDIPPDHRPPKRPGPSTLSSSPVSMHREPTEWLTLDIRHRAFQVDVPRNPDRVEIALAKGSTLAGCKSSCLGDQRQRIPIERRPVTVPKEQLLHRERAVGRPGLTCSSRGSSPA